MNDAEQLHKACVLFRTLAALILLTYGKIINGAFLQLQRFAN